MDGISDEVFIELKDTCSITAEQESSRDSLFHGLLNPDQLRNIYHNEVNFLFNLSLFTILIKVDNRSVSLCSESTEEEEEEGENSSEDDKTDSSIDSSDSEIEVTKL